MVDKDSRLHTNYTQETSTGRLTSENPNLQNIPIKGKYGTEIRSAFVSSSGKKLIVADYSQIELRVVACLSGDEAMQEAFNTDESTYTFIENEIIHPKIMVWNEILHYTIYFLAFLWGLGWMIQFRQVKKRESEISDGKRYTDTTR